MAHVGDIQGAAVLALARGRLDRYPGEHTRGAFWNGPTTVQTRDECLEWNDVAGSPSRAVEAMRELAARGLAGFALEVPAMVGIDVRAHPALAAL